MPDFFSQVLAPGRWPTLVFIIARLTGLVVTAPLWTMTPLTHSMKAAMIVVLAIVLLPSSPLVAVPEQVLDLPFPLAMEFVIGVVIGLTAAVLVYGVALAGEILAIQMGLSMGQVLMPTAGFPDSGIGQIKAFLAMLIYLSVGGHLILLRGVADSLQMLPPGAPMSLANGSETCITLLVTLFRTAICAAAPVMVSLLLTHVAVAILNRVVPQIHTMLVAFPLTIGIGFIMIAASLPVISATIHVWMSTLPASVEGALDSFRLGATAP